jgi:hypothetical protein
MVGFADSAVLVAAFKTKIAQLERRNKNWSQQKVWQEASKWLNDEVLMFAVANTSPAYRTPLSTSRDVLEEIAGKFQSENLIHVSAFIENLHLMAAGVKGAKRKWLYDFLAFFFSAFFSALVNTWRADLMGFNDFEDDREKYLEFWVNDVFWDNMIGSLPYINQATQAIEFEFKDDNKLLPIDSGFPSEIPGLSQLYRAFEDLSQIRINEPKDAPIMQRLFGEKTNTERKLFDALQEFSEMFGFPLKNLRKLVQMTSNAMARQGNEGARDLNRLIRNQTKSEAYYQAIKEGEKDIIQSYVDDKFDSIVIQNEITRLMIANPDQRIKIYDVNYFRSMNDEGTYDYIDIPDKTKDEYNALIQKGLRSLIRSSKYRRFSDEDKIKAIQLYESRNFR